MLISNFLFSSLIDLQIDYGLLNYSSNCVTYQIKTKILNQGDVVRADLVNGNQYRITDIIGTANDLGVENLAAAGMIAGETAKVSPFLMCAGVVNR